MQISTRFMVRDFQYNEEEIQAGRNELDSLIADKKKKYVSLRVCTLTLRVDSLK